MCYCIDLYCVILKSTQKYDNIFIIQNKKLVKYNKKIQKGIFYIKNTSINTFLFDFKSMNAFVCYFVYVGLFVL